MNSSMDQEDKLIYFVKLNGCLHDKSHKDYRNKVVRESKWQEISVELGEDAPTLLKKWTSLRTQFMAYLRRLKKSTGRQAGYRPYFRHEEAMLFLKDASELNESTILNLHGSETNEFEQTEHEFKFQVVDADTCDEDEMYAILNNESSTGMNSLVPRHKETPEGRSHKSTKKRSMTEIEKEALKKMDNVVAEQDLDDEFDLYGKWLAQKLRKIASLDQRQFLMLQHEVNDLVNTAELKLLN